MRTIGIRAAPKFVTFAIYCTEKTEIICVDEIKIPAAFSIPAALKYLRSTLLDILREYEVEGAGVRVTEPTAHKSIERIQIEGVIQEAFASSELQSYYIGQISSISKRVGFDRTRFKPMVDGDNDLKIESWDAMKKEGREAILCAIGATHA